MAKQETKAAAPKMGRPRRPEVFARGGKLYVRYYNAAGVRKRQSTGLAVGQEKEARALLERIVARLEAGERIGEAPEEITLARYATLWMERREQGGEIESFEDDRTRMKTHVIPALGHLRMADIRPRHIRQFIEELKRKKSVRGKPLAPRTVRNVYAALRAMLGDALAEELIENNPCALRRRDLPRKLDLDPTWRAEAVFTRAEAETILSSERVPEDRRVVYALLFLAGVRFGESSALRWRHYDASLAPLGRLTVQRSYSTRKKREKATKTSKARETPVHPVLAAILAEWKLGGWERMMGRQPTPDDLIVPSREGRNRNVNHGLTRFHEDLERLGMRRRRQHDARRTFISLARADGARPDILKIATHGAGDAIIDMYTTMPWAALCEELAKLKIDLRRGEVVELVSTGTDGAPPFFASMTQIWGMSHHEGADGSPAESAKPLNAVTTLHETTSQETHIDAFKSRPPRHSKKPASPQDSGLFLCPLSDESAAGSKLSQNPRAGIVASGEGALRQYAADGDARALRRALLGLLAELD